MFCNDSRNKHYLTALYTPQQNRVVDRRNKNLMEMARSIMKNMSFPNRRWGEAIKHFTYLLIRIATRAIKDQTPYKVYHGRKPNVGHLRVFGCIGYAKVDSKLLKTLDDRSRMLVHLRT